jgi:predicted lipoprotein with Yx(FWY)xxD motif
MKTLMTRTAGMLTAVLLLAGSAQAAGMVTARNGMTLYTFDKDKGGVSSCYGACASKWPPYLGTGGYSMMMGWTLVPRKDGKKQWAYHGEPTYFYKGDHKKGDMTGDGIGGTWHIIAK